jgi:nuclear cap-binding protein subunit 2
MTSLEKYFRKEEPPSFYREKTFRGTDEEYAETLRNSSTVFVAGLSPTVTEERIWELFLFCGPIRRVIMGVNKNTHRCCGFCFVEFYSIGSAEKAVRYLRIFKLDQSPLSVDRDYGFVEGRQYGRGMFGGRVRVDNEEIFRQRSLAGGRRGRLEDRRPYGSERTYDDRYDRGEDDGREVEEVHKRRRYY